MKRTFTMNGKQYTSLMNIARELGVKRVYQRDFDKYGIVETTEQDTPAVIAQPDEVKVEETKVEEKPVEKKQVAAKKSVKKSEAAEKKAEDKSDKRFTRRVGTPEQIKEVQDSVKTMTLVDFSAYIKHFSVEALSQMAEDVKVNTWENMANEPIRKMRLLMELKGYYFPNEKTPVKASSGWKKLSLDELKKVAKKNKVSYKESGDDKIQRMHIVMALNAAGVTPEVKEETTKNAD